MSETPRTDAAKEHVQDLIKCSETLERENQKLRKELALAIIPTTVDAVEREEWGQEREQLREALKVCAKDKVRMDWLCQCTASEREELNNVRLAQFRGALRNAIDAHPSVQTALKDKLRSISILY